MNRRLFLAFALVLAACESTSDVGVTPELPSTKLGPPPGPARARRVVVVSIDGLRPDAIEEAPAANQLALIRRGAYCAKASTSGGTGCRGTTTVRATSGTRPSSA
jgi:hypothetical protein